jgi:hypothetical protein
VATACFRSSSATGLALACTSTFAAGGAYMREASPPERSSSFARSASHAARTAGPTLATVIDPPDTGACGRSLSPSSKRTRSRGKSSVSAAICVITVYVPVPRSCVPERTTTVPSGMSAALACAS